MVAFKKFDELENASKSKNPSKFCLIYGPDFWINNDYINIICKNFSMQNPDIEVMRFNDDDINNDFAKFESCVRSASLFGGSNLALVKIYNDSIASKISALINDYDSDINSFSGGVYIIGNGITNKSKIAQIFEKSNNAWSLRTFPPTRLDLIKIVQKKAAIENVNIDKAAIDALLNHNSNEAGLLISQIENLALYVDKGGTIDEDAVFALNIESKEGALDELINHAFTGNLKNTIKTSFLTFRSNINPIQALNTIMRRIELLNIMLIDIKNGRSPDEIVKDRKFNIFWKEQDNFKKQLSIWKFNNLQNILSHAVKADKLCKTRGSLQIEIVERLLMNIAQTAFTLNKKY